MNLKIIEIVPFSAKIAVNITFLAIQTVIIILTAFLRSAGLRLHIFRLVWRNCLGLKQLEIIAEVQVGAEAPQAT